MKVNEPIYQYVKGEGWIIGPEFPRSPTFQFQECESYFEFRNPKPGEFYDGADSGSVYFPDGSPNWGTPEAFQEALGCPWCDLYILVG